MITQKTFIIQHKEYLNNEFIKAYPQGQFVIQRRDDSINIYVNFKRRTSNASWCYPSAFGIEKCHTNEPVFVKLQNNSFGKITTYKTLDKFLTACNKFLTKEKAIKTFLSYYNKHQKSPITLN